MLGHRDTETVDITEERKKEEERKKKSRNIMSPTLIGLGDIKNTTKQLFQSKFQCR